MLTMSQVYAIPELSLIVRCVSVAVEPSMYSPPSVSELLPLIVQSDSAKWGC